MGSHFTWLAYKFYFKNKFSSSKKIRRTDVLVRQCDSSEQTPQHNNDNSL